VNCNLPKITYSTFRTLLLLKIYEAIYPKADVQVANRAIAIPSFEPRPLNFNVFQQKPILKKVKDSTSVAQYRSSIALELGAKSTQTPQEIGDQFVQFFQASPSNSPEADLEKILLRDLTVSSTEAGQLEFEFGDLAIAAWLQTVLQACVSRLQNSNSDFASSRQLSENPQIFACQYSYARCAALLRLIPLDLIHQSTQGGMGIWLKDNKLLLAQERSLVAQIVTTLDEWEDSSVLKSAIALSQAFQFFYQNCQIVKCVAHNRQIAQCRLALVMITHWLLKQLLEQGLRVLAPETL